MRNSTCVYVNFALMWCWFHLINFSLCFWIISLLCLKIVTFYSFHLRMFSMFPQSFIVTPKCFTFTFPISAKKTKSSNVTDKNSVLISVVCSACQTIDSFHVDLQSWARYSASGQGDLGMTCCKFYNCYIGKPSWELRRLTKPTANPLSSV